MFWYENGIWKESSVEDGTDPKKFYANFSHTDRCTSQYLVYGFFSGKTSVIIDKPQRRVLKSFLNKLAKMTRQQ